MSRDEISGRAINDARPCTNARGLEGDKLGNEKRNGSSVMDDSVDGGKEISSIHLVRPFVT